VVAVLTVVTMAATATEVITDVFLTMFLFVTKTPSVVWLLFLQWLSRSPMFNVSYD
jgi:hypothetical protein